MFVDKAGEHIADIMTMNRSLSSIGSASSILDTSNYTFQAISYGKDADGFRYHAHTILSPSSNGIIKVTSYASTSFSGYNPLSTASSLSYIYKLYPQSFSPLDSRLESKSTLPNYNLNVPDLGQYLNPSISPTLSAFAHLIGGFPSASGTKYQIFNSSGGLISSGTLASSIYNLSGMMDSSGFLNFAQYALPLHQYAYKTTDDDPVIGYNLFNLGVIRSAEVGFPAEVDLKWVLHAGECGALNLFGGVYQIGLWCLDIKEMLKEGNMPPYQFNPLNNVRKYKLFAKKTFNRDLITYSGNSAFNDLFGDGNFSNWTNQIGAIILKWKIRFV
jgi:hypothetical protein